MLGSPGIVALGFFAALEPAVSDGVDLGEVDFRPGSKNISTGRAGFAFFAVGSVFTVGVSRETSTVSSGAAAGVLEISAPRPRPKPRFLSAIPNCTPFQEILDP